MKKKIKMRLCRISWTPINVISKSILIIPIIWKHHQSIWRINYRALKNEIKKWMIRMIDITRIIENSKGDMRN